MKNTHIVNLEVKRAIPFDPHFHGLIDPEGEVDIKLESNTRTEARFRISMKFTFRKRVDKTEQGHVLVEAITDISDVEFVLDDAGKVDMAKAPENLKRLVEGAIGEDILLPVSLMARRARLPPLVPSPHIFPRIVNGAGEGSPVGET